MSILLLNVKERIVMSARRKSNWYIYFTAFGITLVFVAVAIIAFRWFLFPDKPVSTGVDSNGNLSEDFVPSANDNFNTVLMLSQGSSKSPELFLLVGYNAVENRVVFVPLANGISVKSYGKTLPSIYSSDGGQGIADAVNGIMGIKCATYALFDKNAFINIVESFGNVKYNVPKTIIISDNITAESINAGEKLFSADTLYAYIMQADFGEGELYRFNIIGDILSELINQNFRDLDSSRLELFFSSITSQCDTNLDRDYFNAHLAALLYLIQYGVSPAEYYIPYGEYTSDGGFNISENSITTIQQKTGIL